MFHVASVGVPEILSSSPVMDAITPLGSPILLRITRGTISFNIINYFNRSITTVWLSELSDLSVASNEQEVSVCDVMT